MPQGCRCIREDIDRPGLQLRDVDLPLTDLELALDLMALVLKHLGVDLSDDRIGVVLLGTDDQLCGVTIGCGVVVIGLQGIATTCRRR